jgi:hypothetical protein
MNWPSVSRRRPEPPHGLGPFDLCEHISDQVSEQGPTDEKRWLVGKLHRVARMYRRGEVGEPPTESNRLWRAHEASSATMLRRSSAGSDSLSSIEYMAKR